MDNISLYSEAMIRQGSKSFAKAAMLFDSETRASVTMLYAWCRYCDDMIDGQALGHGLQQLSSTEKLQRLEMLRKETERICIGHDSEIPAFAALACVIRKHDIPKHHLFDLLEGFAMDADEVRFRKLNDTLTYCYHVAGVVGVMMAHIMGVRDPEVVHRAADLGIAFQLTNIARDVHDDLCIGRCYLPEEWLQLRGITREELQLARHQSILHKLACDLVVLAEQYYDSARIGMAQLPWRCAWAIASALLIYRDIGLQVRDADMKSWSQRTQVSGMKKMLRLCQGGVMAARMAARKQDVVSTPRSGLWTKQGL